MAEYKVKFHATIDSFPFNRTFTSMQIVEAKSAQEAIEKTKQDYDLKLHEYGLEAYKDEVEFAIDDVEKL